VKGELVFIQDDLDEATFEGDLMWQIDAYEDIHDGFAHELRRRAEWLDFLAERGETE
jgi:hypothetical protein